MGCIEKSNAQEKHFEEHAKNRGLTPDEFKEWLLLDYKRKINKPVSFVQYEKYLELKTKNR